MVRWSTSASVEVLPDGRYPAARVHVGDRVYPAVVGKNGVTPRTSKREGDGCTPAGTFPLRQILYRPDRMARPLSLLPVAEIGPEDVWCDDPSSPDYNTLRRPSSGGAERLQRVDHVYDLLVVVGYNDSPPVLGKGSAIFLHVARDEAFPAASATAGCVALHRAHLAELLSLVPRDATVRIHEEG